MKVKLKKLDRECQEMKDVMHKLEHYLCLGGDYHDRFRKAKAIYDSYDLERKEVRMKLKEFPPQ